MSRVAMSILPLTLVLTACGGGDAPAQTQAPAPAAAEQRAAVRISTPAPGKVVDARPFTGKRLTATLRIAGRAEPGQQLSVRGGCGGYSCDGITFADSEGRWRTRFQLVTPPGKRAVTLTVTYADAADGDKPATARVRVRKATAPPEAAPERRPPETQPATTGGTTAPPAGGGAVAPYAGPRTMIVIGDSLAIGMAGTLRSLLPEWEVPVDARTGRFLSEGMDVLAETELPTGENAQHTILAFSLGTNDGPQNVEALDLAVRESVARLPSRGCAVWATIARPPMNGVSYAAMNRRLMALAEDPQLYGRLIVVPWDRAYRARRAWRRSDGVHATPEGYAGRAQMYADAAASCPA